MPSHVSSEKRVRQTAKRTAVNKNRVTRVRSIVRKAEEALAGSDKKAATAAFKLAEKGIMKGVSKGVIHRNAASRKVSRLARRLKTLSN